MKPSVPVALLSCVFVLGCQVQTGAPAGPADPARSGSGGRSASSGAGGSGAGGNGGAPAAQGGQSGQGSGAGGSSPASTDAGSPGGPPSAGDDPTLPHLDKVVPVLLITVDGKAIPRDLKIAGRIKVIEDHDGSMQSLQSLLARPATMDAPIGIEIRGQSSFNFDQKPYGFEIRNDQGEGVPVPLLGLPAEADFVLHSCYADKSCMRNALTYAVGREMATQKQRWAPRTRYVEVFLDGKYQGLYLLVERIKRDKTRVDLPRPAPDAAMGDLTGGYIVSQEGDGGRLNADFVNPLDARTKLVYRFPKADEITPAQKRYLEGAVRTLGQAAAGPPMSEATRKRIDIDSFLDYALIQELTNNVDGYWKSWFMYKAPDAAGGQFFMGPLWDFDLGYGNIIMKKRYCANNLAYSELRGPLARFFDDPAFTEALRCRWNTLRASGGPLDITRMEAKLDRFAQHITRAKARDGERWKNLDLWVWPNNFIGGTWDSEVKYLRYWLRKRLAYLDQGLPGACSTVPAPPAVEPIAAPAKVMERNLREPYAGRDAPTYIPIEGTLPANLAAWACPK